MPGAFKLDHLQSFESLLFWKFSNFFTFISGPFLTTPNKEFFCIERLLTAPLMGRLEGEVVGPCRSREVPPQAVRGQAVAAFIVVEARRIEAVLKSLQLH